MPTSPRISRAGHMLTTAASTGASQSPFEKPPTKPRTAPGIAPAPPISGVITPPLVAPSIAPLMALSYSLSIRAPPHRRQAPRFSLTRREKCAALVLAAGDEVWRRIYPGHEPAFRNVPELFLAIRLPVCVGRKLHVVLIYLNIDGLFALVVRGGPRVGARSRSEHEGGGVNDRCKRKTAIPGHSDILRGYLEGKIYASPVEALLPQSGRTA